MAAVSPARSAAFRILLAVERGEGRSDDLLRAQSVSALDPADRNLTTTLVLGLLRWQIALDQQIKAQLARPNAKLDAEVRIALRLGAFQLLHLNRIPAHAAIDESVELAKHAGHRFAASMVNAVLRKLAAEGIEVLKGRAPSASSGQAFSRAEQAQEKSGALAPETTAYPAWILDRWTRNYGAEATCAICRHGQNQPALSIRVSDAAAEAELLAAGIELVPGALLTAARTVSSGDVTATAAFRAGRVRIQDEGSQVIAEIAGSAMPSVEGQGKILDACAAPGGKTLILAERHPTARIVACESSPRRFAPLSERLGFLGDRVECRLADASLLEDNAAFDLALADVPCSGTGTLGRNPEIRHRLTADDLPRQAKRQRAILQAALRAVRPGGRVIYSTCSLEPEENEEVVAAVLAENAAARQFPVALETLRRAGILMEDGADRLAPCVTPEGALQLLPGAAGTDGFFAALLERMS